MLVYSQILGFRRMESAFFMFGWVKKKRTEDYEAQCVISLLKNIALSASISCISS